MNYSKDILEEAKKAASPEELIDLAKREGINLSESDAKKYFSFLNSREELTDEELSQVAGGKEGSYCTTAPTPFCTGLFYGLDSCKFYEETADPNGIPTPYYGYPVLCTCTRGHYSNVHVNRPCDP